MRLKEWSAAARRDAIEKFAPLIQAQRYLEFYDDLLHRRSARRGRVRAAYKNEAPCINIDRAASFDRIFNSVASEAILPAYSNLVREHEESEIDRYLRGEQIATLTKMLKESEADRAARLEVIEAQGKQLQASEADRAARLEIIEAQSKQLGQIVAQLGLVTDERDHYRNKINLLTQQRVCKVLRWLCKWDWLEEEKNHQTIVPLSAEAKLPKSEETK